MKFENPKRKVDVKIILGMILSIVLIVPVPIALMFSQTGTGSITFQIHDDTTIIVGEHVYVVHDFNATVHKLVLIGQSNVTVMDNETIDLTTIESIVLVIPSQDYYGFFLNVTANWNVTEDGTNNFNGSFSGYVAINMQALGLAFHLYPNRNIQIKYDVGVPTAPSWVFGAGGSINVFGIVL